MPSNAGFAAFISSSSLSPRCSRFHQDERVIVECFGQDLRSFPKGIPLDVTDLDLGNNAITSLANELSKFKQIQEL